MGATRITARLTATALLLAGAAMASERPLPVRHHPVETAVPAAMTVPDGFPLERTGRLACATCHPDEAIETLPLEEVDKDRPDFLRGGPYPRLETFCFRCHDDDGYRRPNIHQLLDAGGDPIEERCEQCHDGVPERSAPDAARRVRFRVPVEKVCIGCHLLTPHLNAPNHLQRPSEAMREHIAEAERRYGVRLPLDGAGRIMCATCHAPHGPGLLDPDSAAGKQVADAPVDEGIGYRETAWSAVYRADKRERLEHLAATGEPLPAPHYRRVADEVLLRLPAKDGRLCRACHRFEGTP